MTAQEIREALTKGKDVYWLTIRHDVFMGIGGLNVVDTFNATYRPLEAHEHRDCFTL